MRSGRPASGHWPSEDPAGRPALARDRQVAGEAGYDAEAITSRGDLVDNLPDAQVMEIAHQEGRVVVTNNVKDFRPIAALRMQGGQGHSGLILVSSNTRRNRAANRRWRAPSRSSSKRTPLAWLTASAGSDARVTSRPRRPLAGSTFATAAALVRVRAAA